jgi:hypothetical protein
MWRVGRRASTDKLCAKYALAAPEVIEGEVIKGEDRD